MQKQLYIKTPLFHSNLVKKRLNKDVYFKMECHQPSEVLRSGGMENLCRHHISQGEKAFIIASGGNAGYSLAYSGKELGVQVKVVVNLTRPAKTTH